MKDESGDKPKAGGPGRPGGSTCGRWLLRANVAALLLVAIWFRFDRLDHLPGINGDEAWYGVQAERVVHGEPIAWRTPTGNLLNPLFFGPLLLLHTVFEPSFGLLRSFAAINGVLALAMNFWLCRGVFGKRIATISTLILAVLPVNIAYSRIAWDASQSLLVALPVIYWSLRAARDIQQAMRYGALSLAAYAIAIIVHPTNIFLGPIIVVCFASAIGAARHRRERTPCRSGLADAVCPTRNAAECVPNSRAVWRLAVAAMGAAIMCFAVLKCGMACIVARALNPHEYAEFLRNLTGLLACDTVYNYFTGAPSSVDSLNAVAIVLRTVGFITLGAVFIGCWRLASRRDRASSRLLAIGLAVALAAFFAIAGPDAIAPNFQRYGIWIVAPTGLLVAIGLDGWVRVGGRSTKIAVCALVACAWLLLADFQCCYFDFLAKTGGQAHLTFRTARIEPKQTALDYITAHSPADKAITIAASDWWNYWPLLYLSYGSAEWGRISVIEGASGQPAPPFDKLPSGLSFRVEDTTGRPAPMRGEGAGGDADWFVEFTQRDRAAELRSSGRLDEKIIADYSGRPILSLFHRAIPAASVQSQAAGVQPARKIKVPNLTNCGVDIGLLRTDGDRSESRGTTAERPDSNRPDRDSTNAS